MSGFLKMADYKQKRLSGARNLRLTAKPEWCDKTGSTD